jgi:hypothetical protein
MITWFFPNRPDSWQQGSDKLTRNHYATRFATPGSSPLRLRRDAALRSDTERFHDALFSSTLPPYVLTPSPQTSCPFAATPAFWLEDGRFFGWEGCFDDKGCCPGSCTHVWSYAYTVAFLFPLPRARDAAHRIRGRDGRRRLHELRTFQTFGQEFVWQWGNRNLKRPWTVRWGAPARLPGVAAQRRQGWLSAIWPGIRSAIVYASNHWDTDGDGILDGRQHNTYDIDFYGPNPLSSIHFLAGLRAVEELAQVMVSLKWLSAAGKAFEATSGRLDQLSGTGSITCSSSTTSTLTGTNTARAAFQTNCSASFMRAFSG